MTIPPPRRPAHILLVVGGGIAAYKSAELVRLIRKAGMTVRCVMTDAAQHFITPMTLAALSENQVFTTLWDLKDEAEMGHIQLSREADLVVVCPATADLLAKMAAGIADSLATTLLLATDTPVLAAPAMNVRMWTHAVTRRNVAGLRADGIDVMQPDEGDMACGEYGPGRLPEPPVILDAIKRALRRGRDVAGASQDAFVSTSASAAPRPALAGGRWMEGQPDFAATEHRPLHGRRVLVTAGPTHEPIDPVRYIANRSSGKQGFAIAAAAADAGAQVTLIAGPVSLPTPAGVVRIDVETAREMAEEVERALPTDVAIMVAAVADWRTADAAEQKMKKQGGALPSLSLVENPDILAGLSASARRPGLVIGFAAETENVIEHARAKLAKKGCDWIVANDVSGDVMGGSDNAVHVVTADGVESWDNAPKQAVAHRLVARIVEALAEGPKP